MGDTAMAVAGATSSGRGGGCGGFMVQLLRGRWFMIFASFLIMIGAGATYLFGVYSKEIKASLGYDQSTLNLLASCKDLGANVGVLSGLLAEVTPTWFVLLVGAALNFVGYFLIWLAVTEKIPKPTVWQMCIYICIGANSQNFANTGALVTSVKNFPASRGIMLGLMKGFVGLSGAVFTQIYHAIYGNDSKSLILLIAWLPASISIVFVYTIRMMKVSRHPKELKIFHEYLYISIALALCLMALTIAQKQFSFSHYGYIGSTIVVCVLIFLPCVIAIREELIEWKIKKVPINAPCNILVEESIPPAAVGESKPEYSKTQKDNYDGKKKKVSCFANIFSPPNRGEDYTILQALLSIDMLILFMATFCGLGCSLTAVDSLGQIGESLGYPTHTISTFVSLVSIWNYFGRVSAGFVSEIILMKWKVPRPLMMTLALLISSISDILIAFPFPGSVFIASLMIGFSFGAQLTLLFTIVSEIFGLKYYSTLLNCSQLVSPLGSYILNVRIVGKLYDKEALKQLALKGMTRSMVKDLTCIGKQCYRLSFIILACTNILGAMVSLILVMRTREYYRGDIYKKFKEDIAANEREKLPEINSKVIIKDGLK